MFSAVAEVQSLRPPARAPLYTAAFAHPQPARTAAPSMLQAVLDEVNHGLVLLTEEAEVTFANRVARRDCSADRPLHIDGARLRLARAADRDALMRALAAARTGRRTMLTIASAEGDMPVGVVPVGDNGNDAVALLILGRRGQSEPLTLQFFAQTYHLTSAESGVVSALCEGLRPTQIASRSGVAISTVRTQISSIRQKTQAKSIGHIVRMIEAMPPIASAQGVPAESGFGRFVA